MGFKERLNRAKEQYRQYQEKREAKELKRAVELREERKRLEARADVRQQIREDKEKIRSLKYGGLFEAKERFKKAAEGTSRRLERYSPRNSGTSNPFRNTSTPRGYNNTGLSVNTSVYDLSSRRKGKKGGGFSW